MQLQQAYALCIDSGDTVFDIGANVGQTAVVLSALVGPKGKCVSFEPHPLMFAHLAMAAARPELFNVLPYCRALSYTKGHIGIFAGTDAASAEASTMVPDLVNHDRLGREIQQFRIETDTIDNFVTSSGLRPRFIKIDVEGAEQYVLAGAKQVLNVLKPNLVFEFGFGISKAGLPPHFAQLTQAGYNIFLVDLMMYEGSFTQQPFDGHQLLEYSRVALSQHAPISGNMLAVHHTRQAALMQRFESMKHHNALQSA